MNIAKVQTRLAAAQLYHGAIDGALGPLTYAAIFASTGARTNAALLGQGAARYFPEFAITTGLRIAHFIAQTGHETGGFKWLNELWGPTPAQRRYEGRRDLGNVQPGDGKRFAGRGLLQITGRANYARIAKRTGLPLLTQPEIASLPDNAVWTACIFWDDHRLNRLADADDTLGLTRAINGGRNGLADRAIRTAALKRLLT